VYVASKSDLWVNERAIYGDAGVTCEGSRTRRRQSMLDGFEAGILDSHWSVVDGGVVGNGCGTLLPVAHGKSLYFDGCGQRQAVTVELDLTKARSVLTCLLTYSFSVSCLCYPW